MEYCRTPIFRKGKNGSQGVAERAHPVVEERECHGKLGDGAPSAVSDVHHEPCHVGVHHGKGRDARRADREQHTRDAHRDGGDGHLEGAVANKTGPRSEKQKEPLVLSGVVAWPF